MNKAESLAVLLTRLDGSDDYTLSISQTGAWTRLTLTRASGYKREVDYINADIVTTLYQFLLGVLTDENS